jgi:hypothetical protein
MFGDYAPHAAARVDAHGRGGGSGLGTPTVPPIGRGGGSALGGPPGAVGPGGLGFGSGLGVGARANG